jgi:hypothetical protein
LTDSSIPLLRPKGAECAAVLVLLKTACAPPAAGAAARPVLTKTARSARKKSGRDEKVAFSQTKKCEKACKTVSD